MPLSTLAERTTTSSVNVMHEMIVPFVKGHCGWDAVTLIPEGVIPAERELGVALKILDGPLHGGSSIS